MITVHHLNRSRSHRVIWLLEELGVKYDIVYYQRDKSGRAPPEFRKLHPIGTAPLITDGEFTLVESGAIIEYLLYRYGNDRLKPVLGTPE
ncbi:MAG: glutathione S-transferase, partial [Pseudomonadota bacterium]|nr:glutathione S-transferase [Pseudomonadota bacterium]